ncbi:MAG TPA: TetR/AcrR family transcriptional regulator [Caulobacteraceae bacterium]|nr:TetR/AcrR family transcriptional regulator [Caulobacteraceae bacterium]
MALALRAERRSQAQRRDEAEQRLLSAGVRLVGERGLERITLTEVGEAAGYSRGLPAHYFGGKDGLVVALATHLIEGFGRALERSEHRRPGLERLLGMVTFYLDRARKEPAATRALFVLLGEGLSNGLVTERLARLNARGAKAIEMNLRAAIATGDVGNDIDVTSQAILILAGLRGAVGLWLLAPDVVDLRAVRDEFIASLRRSLVP